MWSAVFFSRSCRAFRWVWALRLPSRRETWGDSTAGMHMQMVSAGEGESRQEHTWQWFCKKSALDNHSEPRGPDLRWVWASAQAAMQGSRGQNRQGNQRACCMHKS